LCNVEVSYPGIYIREGAMKTNALHNVHPASGQAIKDYVNLVNRNAKNPVHKLDIKKNRPAVLASKKSQKRPPDQLNGVQVVDGSNPSTPILFSHPI
jgi:hypothetical protein